MDNQTEVVNKKKTNKLVIVIILLVIVILGLVGYICYDKGVFYSKKATTSNTSKKENKDKHNSKEESVTFSDSELEEYVSYIKPVSIGPSELLYNTDSVNSENLSMDKKIEYIGSYLYGMHTTSSDYKYDIIKEADVKNAVEKIYGPNVYQKTTFNLGCADYNLNENDNNYYSATGCGGTTTTMVSNEVVSYNATKTKLEITTKYVLLDGMENKLYKDYDKTISVGEYTENGDSNEITSYLKEFIKNNKDKLNSIVYTFESDDGVNYYFKGFINNK